MGTGTVGQRPREELWGAWPRRCSAGPAPATVNIFLDRPPHTRPFVASLYGWATCLRYLRFFCSSSFIDAMLCSNLASISSCCRASR